MPRRTDPPPPAPTELDEPWKEALEHFFPECLALLLPHVHAAIDWTKNFRFLDKELTKATPKHARGTRITDKLVQVWRRDGTEAWVLIHVEIQNQRDSSFARRMFEYHTGLRARHALPLMSVAILGDESAGWRPDRYTDELWGCSIDLRFPVVKLQDFRGQLARLEAERNPFAAIVLAHLAAQATRKAPQARLAAKLDAIRRLARSGYTRPQIEHVLRLVDWLLLLPEDLDRELWQTIEEMEEAAVMDYVTSIERIGIRKGHAQGLAEGMAEGKAEGKAEGVSLAIEARYGQPAARVAERVSALRDLALLDRIASAVRSGQALQEIAQLLDNSAP